MTDDKSKNQPTPKPKVSVGSKLLKMLLVFAVTLVAGALAAYSLKLGQPPWSWSNDDWSRFLQFSKEKAKDAETRISDVTKDLIEKAPGLLRRIEEKLSGKPATAENATGPDGKPTTAAPARDDSEYKLGLKAMHAGIEHYRASADNASEIKEAMKCFEEAKDHLTKAAKDAPDDATKKEIVQDLNDTNKYIEDCKARSKT